MKAPNKSSLLTIFVMLLMALGAGSAPAQGYHHGYHRFHVWRNNAWVWEYHPAGWVIPTANIGPVSVSIGTGWGYHPGWHRYHVWRNHHWAYVYHPVGWAVPAEWRGPRHYRHW